MGSKDPLGLLRQWANTYGDIFHYRLLNRHVYFLNHPDHIKYVLATAPLNFIKGQAVRANRRIFGNGLVSNEGASWARQRRLLQPAFHHERIESYAATMVEYTGRLLASWQDGETRDIHQDMMQVTLEIVARALFSVEIASHRDRFSAALDTLMGLSVGARLLLPPALRLIPTPGNIRFLRATRQLDSIVYEIIAQRRSETATSHIDVLDTLLQSRFEDGSPMPNQLVRDETMTLLLAGHETTATSLSWTWLLLSQHPEVEAKLWNELATQLQGSTPALRDLPRLPYTERVIKEAMRLYPPVWALVRNAVEDCEIGGYRIPAGDTIFMSQWVMHRDARFYEDPGRFDPDRWLDERARNIPRYAYFPFGGGPRSCIGAAFATTEAALVLATIAQRFQLRVVPGQPLDGKPTITLRPRHGIKAVVTRRSSS